MTEGVPLRWSMTADVSGLADHDLSTLSIYAQMALVAVLVLSPLAVPICLCVCLCYWCKRGCWRREQPMTQPLVELPVIPMSQPGMVQQAQVVAKAV